VKFKYGIEAVELQWEFGKQRRIEDSS